MLHLLRLRQPPSQSVLPATITNHKDLHSSEMCVCEGESLYGIALSKCTQSQVDDFVIRRRGGVVGWWRTNVIVVVAVAVVVGKTIFWW